MIKKKNFLGHCEKCKKSLCPEHVYFYVDGNNISVTNSSPYLCKECYEKEYNTIIKTELDLFKENLINTLLQFKEKNHIEMIKIENLIKYIENL